MAVTPLWNNPQSPNVDAVLQNLLGVCSIAWDRFDGIRLLQNTIGSKDPFPLYIFQPNTWPPNLCAFFCGTEVCVYSDGTYNLGQLLGDIVGAFGKKFEGTDTVAHSFFYDAAKQFRQWLQDWSNSFDHPRVTGWNLASHSYGGAATDCLATLLLREGFTNIKPCLFSGPRWCARPIPDPHFEGSLNIHGNQDPIPYVPNFTFNASIVTGVIPALVTGIPIIWNDFTKHFDYTDGTPRMAPTEAPSRLLSLSPNVWGMQHVLCGHIDFVDKWWHAVHGANSTSPLLDYLHALCDTPRPETLPPAILNLSDEDIANLDTIYFRNNPACAYHEGELTGCASNNVLNQ